MSQAATPPTPAQEWRAAHRQFTARFGQVLKQESEYRAAAERFDALAPEFAAALKNFARAELSLRESLRDATDAWRRLDRAVKSWESASRSTQQEERK